MSVPVDEIDEIDVGRDTRARAPWHDWSPRRRLIAGVVAVVVAVAVVVVGFVVREPSAPRATPEPVAAAAPGATVVEHLSPDTSRCPPAATCRYDDTIAAAAERAFAAAFGSAGYIGRQSVVDADTGEVYWQFLRFATGTLVTVTLTQEPLSRLTVPPVVVDSPTDVDRKNGAVTLTAVRDGYLLTANAAALPGQVLPVPSVQQWLRTAPAP